MTWVETAAPLSMVVGCGGERHRLRWERGQVVTQDHPELEAELALVAFGGPEPTCVALHRLWLEALADGGFVAEWADPNRLSPVWLSWLGMALERMRTEGFHEFLRHLPSARAQRMGEFLHRFPPPWIDRAAAEVSQTALEGGRPIGDADAHADVHAESLAQAAGHRLRRAFVDAVGGRQLAVGTAALIPLRLRVEAGAQPAVDGSLVGPGRGIGLRVDPRWLHRVWAAGAAVVDGHLTLAIDAPDTRSGSEVDGSVRAIQIEWPAGPSGPPALVRRAIRHDGERWTAIWSTGEAGEVEPVRLDG